MKRLRLVLLLVLFIFCLGAGATQKVEASSSINVLKKVPKKTTPAGKWVKSTGGFRYRYTYNGAYARNTWLCIKGKIYYFNSKGYRVSGLKKYQGNYYYLNNRGVLTTGWKTIGTKTYYFSERTGAALTGWKNIGTNRYCFGPKGALYKNCWVDDCYLGTDGVLLRNTTVDGYYVDADGRRTEVILEDDGPLAEPSTWDGTYIFVGDSRTVGMQSVVGGDHTYIAKTGEGYSWLTSTAITSLKKALKKTPNAKVILNLGVNDLGNISNYLAYYRSLISQYPGAHFYFLSVNPIEAKRASAYGYSTSVVNNTLIQSFNANLKAAFPDQYLDCYSYLVEQGLIKNVKAGKGTVDGIHYTSTVYLAIYNYVLSNTQ